MLAPSKHTSTNTRVLYLCSAINRGSFSQRGFGGAVLLKSFVILTCCHAGH